MANLGEHAVVIGGSLAGLMSARVLADHFESVTVLERDHIDPGPRCTSRFRRATISTVCFSADNK